MGRGRAPVVVVYKKPRGRKYFVKVFENMYVDDIIDANKRKPPIPHEYDIIEIGVGLTFLEDYIERYNATIVEDE